MVTHSVDYARAALRDGEIVVFPTETAYGIAADATDPDAVEEVYEVKERPRSKGLTAICSSLEQAKRFSSMTEDEIKLAEKLMPGPLTLVVEKNEKVPDNLNEKFAFRVSSSSLARTLASDFPITATSANISGGETAYSVEDVPDSILGEAGGVVDKGKLEKRPTSTIVEIVDGEPVIHREGPITLSEVEEALGE